MQSNHTPDVSSTNIHPNAGNNAENSSCSPSRQNDISVNLRRPRSKLTHTTPPPSDDECPSKRKFNSSEENSEKVQGTANDTEHKPSDSKRYPYGSINSTSNQSPPIHPSDSEYSAMLNLSPHVGSIEEGRRYFDILLGPVTLSTFMNAYWEKQPLCVNRKKSDFYEYVLTSDAIDKMFRRKNFEFSKHVDVKSKDGIEVITPIGRASSHKIWQYYIGGCGITIFNPQIFFPTIHSMVATFQEYFQCTIDSTVHLGSENGYGHSPRYEDAETIILQVEGKKHWRLYAPHRSHMLSRESKNIDLEHVHALGPPLLDVELKAGDLLYFPRGYVNETTSSADSHSLHLQISLFRKHTFGDLLEILLPMALKDAINNNQQLRRGLPIDIWQNMGIVNSDNYYRERNEIISQITECFKLVTRHVMAEHNLDDAVDQMALKYQRNALPPTLTPEERTQTVYGAKITSAVDGLPRRNWIGLDSGIRLVRGNVVRLVRHENSSFRVYYSSENSNDRDECEGNYLEVGPAEAPAVEVLIKAYPSYITPRDLDLENEDKCLFFVCALWERGILMSECPLV